MQTKTALMGISLVAIVIGITLIIRHDNKRAEDYQEYVQKAPERNKQKLLEPAEIVGVTDDGQEVKRVVIEYVKPKPCDSCEVYPEKHFIYFVGKVKTDNAIVPSGKSTKIEPRVTIEE